MTIPQKLTKEQLLNTIDNIKKNPNDRVRILGDAGITILSGGLGAAAAGTVASAMGATSIFGLTAAAKVIGITVASATPIGWVLGASVAGAAAAYGITRMIRGGSISEGKRNELLLQYQQQLKDVEAKERAGSISGDDKTNFIASLRELIEKDVITPEKASQLIKLVEQGRIPISQAVSIVQDLLQEKHTNKLDEAKAKSEKTDASIELQLQKNSELIKELISEIESKNEIIEQHNELLLSHDQSLLNHTLAFQKVQEYVEQLQQKNIDLLNQIQTTNVEANKTKLLSRFAAAVSLVALVIVVALMFK